MQPFDYLTIWDDTDITSDETGITFDEFPECEWQESTCPVCNRKLDSHDSQRMTRCAATEFDARNTT